MVTSVNQKKKPKRRAKKAVIPSQAYFDDLVLQHKTTQFAQEDPISLPHRYFDDPQTCELVAFISGLMAYGRRDLIIRSADNLLARMDNDPRAFIENFDLNRDSKCFEGFVYRFYKPVDMAFLCATLQRAVKTYGSVENCWLSANVSVKGLSGEEPVDLKTQMTRFVDLLLKDNPPKTYGQKFMFPHPARGGPCKRLHMLLRWLVRDDSEGERVDLGLWKEALSPRDLMIPLDTHVIRMGQFYGLTQRQSPSWEMADEITDYFRQLCPDDPVKYDFALMGAGLTREDEKQK